MKKKEEKNPFVNNMTPEEIQHAETHFSYIQVGLEVPSEAGRYTFKNDRANVIFKQMLESLKLMKHGGSTSERTDAHFCLQHLRLIPLRIH